MANKAIPALFTKSEETARMYEQLMEYVSSLGRFEVEEKRTCIHVVAGKGAFLGVHPRKAGLRITVVLSHGVTSSRIAKCEKASANRFHIDLDVSKKAPLDKQVQGWIQESYSRATSNS